MQRTCKQCGKEFEITGSEIHFYKSKGLNLPRRCKECRELNRQSRGEDSKAAAAKAEIKNENKKFPVASMVIGAAVIIAIVVVVIAFALR